MATKPKKTSTSSKSAAAKSKATAKKTATATKKTVGKETTKTISTAKKGIFTGFFACKHDPNETILTIFKSHKIWGAVAGELIGTMLLMMVLLTLGVQPLYLIFATIGIVIAVVSLSGANLNPLVTVGMMATRRMSAIRGVMYILAQVVGAWLGLILINWFRLGSGTASELPTMDAITGDTFWAVTLIELLGAFIIGFVFARAIRYRKTQPMTFALAVTSAMTLAVILGIVIGQSFFEYGTVSIFNPAAALMYQILPSAADTFGQLVGDIALALCAYVIVPMIGGVIGFFASDASDRLADNEEVKE